MQQLFVVGSSVAVLALVSLWIVRHTGATAAVEPPWRVLLGVIAGVLGALVVLIPRIDLIPDQLEPELWVLVIAIASGVVLVVLYRRA